MSADLFRRAGAALYGSRWKPDMGDALNMQERNLRRYAAGSIEMSPSMCLSLADLCDERAGDLAEMATELRAVAADL